MNWYLQIRTSLGKDDKTSLGYYYLAASSFCHWTTQHQSKPCCLSCSSRMLRRPDQPVHANHQSKTRLSYVLQVLWYCKIHVLFYTFRVNIIIINKKIKTKSKQIAYIIFDGGLFPRNVARCIFAPNLFFEDSLAVWAAFFCCSHPRWTFRTIL